MRVFLAVLALLIGLTPTNAQIAGQNDPQFKAALELWLEGEDFAALTALSGLAKADNRAAQVFLGRVDSMRHTHTHVTKDMDRKARNNLMRAKGSVLGINWLRVAEVDTPLATAFRNVHRSHEKLDAIVQLLEFQEYAAATAALRDSMGDILGEDFIQINEVLKHSTIPPHLRTYFHSTEEFWKKSGKRLWITLKFRVNISKEQFLQQDAFNWPFFTLSDLLHDKISADQIDPYFVNNPLLAPLQNLCSETCGEDVPKCMRALNWVQFWAYLHSPTETLLSNEQYLASPRIRNDLKRYLDISGKPQYWTGQLKQYDQCAYKAALVD